MESTSQLKNDHKAILRGLELLRSIGFAMQRNEAESFSDADSMLNFFRTFADHCHHAKEETVLFPALIDKGMSKDDGPIWVMLMEHDQGRALVRKLQQSLDAKDSGGFIRYSHEYSGFLQDHIGKEDQILFPVADGMLNAEDDKSVMEGFNRIEETMGESTHEEFHKLLRTLSAKYLVNA